MNKPFLLPKDYVVLQDRCSGSYSVAEAEAYTRWLTQRHYENFHIVSLFLPKRLHQDFYNVYAFCRWADDLGDEIGNRAESLRLLDWWRRELDEMYLGRAVHPVYVALHATVARRGLPPQPFHDLIQAFVQDQTVTRYESYAQLFDYCRYSANPVGRLVLHLCGYSDEERQALSDATCTALQLANHWQDILVDLDKDRIYLPREALERHGSSFDDVLNRRATPGFRAALKEGVGVARGLFAEGLPLAATLDRRLALDIDLFSRGGMRILEKIEEQDYNVFERRPRILRTDRIRLFVGALARLALRKAR